MAVLRKGFNANWSGQFYFEQKRHLMDEGLTIGSVTFRVLWGSSNILRGLLVSRSVFTCSNLFLLMFVSEQKCFGRSASELSKASKGTGEWRKLHHFVLSSCSCGSSGT
jgi:hypothetical protein